MEHVRCRGPIFVGRILMLPVLGIVFLGMGLGRTVAYSFFLSLRFLSCSLPACGPPLISQLAFSIWGRSVLRETPGYFYLSLEDV